MADLSYLLGSTPAASATAQTSTTGLPDWYLQASQGLAARGADLASQPYQAYPGDQVAGFTDAQNQSFADVNANQGNWTPYTNAATTQINNLTPQLNQQLGQSNQYGTAAVNSVSGSTPTWNSATAASYMSPYQDQVVQNIADQGNKNLLNNIIPGVNDTFIGGGQFGSTRNADIIGRAIDTTQNDISQQQAAALNTGYTNAQTQFNADQSRNQNQQQLAANTNLAAGNLSNSTGTLGAQTGLSTAQALSGLGAQTSQLSSGDAASLNAIGTQQQQQNQLGLTTAQNNFNNQNNYDWTQLSNLSGLLNSQQLPTTTANNTTQTGSNSTTSPLAALAGLYGTYRGITS